MVVVMVVAVVYSRDPIQQQQQQCYSVAAHSLRFHLGRHHRHHHPHPLKFFFVSATNLHRREEEKPSSSKEEESLLITVELQLLTSFYESTLKRPLEITHLFKLCRANVIPSVYFKTPLMRINYSLHSRGEDHGILSTLFLICSSLRL